MKIRRGRIASPLLLASDFYLILTFHAAQSFAMEARCLVGEL